MLLFAMPLNRKPFILANDICMLEKPGSLDQLK